MHPTIERLIGSWTKREVERQGPTTMEAEEQVKAELRRIGAPGLFTKIQRNAHLQDMPYTEALRIVIHSMKAWGIPPRWALRE